MSLNNVCSISLGFDRSSDFRTSTSSLTTHWPQRSNSEKWEREDSVSLSGELSHTLPVGVSSSQPNVPWPDLKKGKRKRSGLLTGKLRRSTGSKRGSVTSVGEWCERLLYSSIILTVCCVCSFSILQVLRLCV